MSRTGVVFVNFHSAELIAPRAELMAGHGLPVVVADNSGELGPSGDAAVIDTGANRGFAAACNRAVRTLAPDIERVCFHNPDVDISPADIERLADSLKPGAAAVAPAIRSEGVVRRRGFHYPAVAREAVLAARAIRGRDRQRGRDEHATDLLRVVRHERGRRFATGALLVVDRHAFERIGGFDEQYFLYAEDLDLWHRLGRAGWRTEFVPEIVAEHAGASGSRMGAGTRELLRWLGVELFVEKVAGQRWRRYRRAHQPFLGGIDAPAWLTDGVANAWGAGATPARVLGDLRPRLEERVPLAVGEAS